MKVLLSAYACEPDVGSEPGVGWSFATSLALDHEVWVLTRANNRRSIEAALEGNRVPNLHFLYFDLPRWLGWWKRGIRGSQLYYYLWQVLGARVALAAHRQYQFDLAHHVTFAKYWSPSLLTSLPLRYVWGPLGGGDSTPLPFVPQLSVAGKMYEVARVVARRAAERDPRLRRTATRSGVALAATEATAGRLRALGATDVQILSQVALSQAELDQLGSLPRREEGDPIRFLSIGRLLDLKATSLGLRAFARADLPGARMEIIGEGPERHRLEKLAESLGVEDRVLFTGHLPRQAVLQRLARATALVHPSLHDSGGVVCAEALSAGVPVVCLDLGGPALQVTGECGYVIPASCPQQVMATMTTALEELVDPDLHRDMSAAASARARSLNINEKRLRINAVYDSLTGPTPLRVERDPGPGCSAQPPG